MKLNNIICVAVSAVLALGCVCCSGSDSGNGNGSQTLSAEEQTEAVNKGRLAARALINVAADDTLGMQSKLLEARAIQSSYLTAGRKAQAEVFDTAFIHTLRAVRPDIAREIELMTDNR